jgi:hypothetical protein
MNTLSAATTTTTTAAAAAAAAAILRLSQTRRCSTATAAAAAAATAPNGRWRNIGRCNDCRVGRELSRRCCCLVLSDGNVLEFRTACAEGEKEKTESL